MFLLMIAPGFAAATVTFTSCAAHAAAPDNKPAATATYSMSFMLVRDSLVRSGRSPERIATPLTSLTEVVPEADAIDAAVHEVLQLERRLVAARLADVTIRSLIREV
jgi:hypothetical protein